MPGFLSRLKGREVLRKKRNNMQRFADSLPQKPKWDDAYTRPSVEPEEIHELLHICTAELKARGLDIPFLLLPYRPTSDPSAVRTFVRRFFDINYGLKGETLGQELRMSEPMVISGVVKWCWSRISGGVVGWDAYELFKIGEGDSRMARDSFKTFIPLSVESGARQRIIFDFFELIAAIAAHGKINGFGGHQLPRMVAWWAFEHKDTGSGFDGGYKAWQKAADATTHLFFAYLRSLTPEEGLTGITLLPRSLEKLLGETEYPPKTPATLVSKTNKLVMLVDTVSPTPFALLRRAGHFQYRDSDPALQQFSDYDDPVQALTEECLRVLRAISAANESQVSSVQHSTSLRDASWSRFEDIGFAGTVEEEPRAEDSHVPMQHNQVQGLRGTPTSGTDLGRPTTPSWADFLSSGFVDENEAPSNVLLPPDKALPPIEAQIRQQSSQSHHPRLETTAVLQPGELASIALLHLDNAFWWVWMSSLAPEETSERKSAFGRCAVIETKVAGGSWLVMEEIIAGTTLEPKEGAYIAEKKKGLFSWTKRGRSLARRKSVGKHALDRGDKNGPDNFGSSRTNIGPETHARIQAKAAQMRAVKESEQLAVARRGRTDDQVPEKTTSVLSLHPSLAPEAMSAMRWAKKYDKGTIKDAYLANNSAGRGIAVSSPTGPQPNGSAAVNGSHPVEDNVPEVPVKDENAVIMAAAPNSETGVERSPFQVAQPAVETDDIPVPPPKDFDTPVTPVTPSTPSMEIDRAEKSPRKGMFQANKEKSGLRKLFKRKNRSSRVPENAPANLERMLPKEAVVADEPSRPSEAVETPKSEESTPVASPVQETSARTNESPSAMEGTPDAPQDAEPSDDPSGSEELAPVETNEAVEANREFARFDQGPLTDQPAFVPDDDDATPPPIARHPISRGDGGEGAQSDQLVEKLSHSAGPGVQDRWAQIRKNAAQRAAARQRDDNVRPNKTSGDDDDTSVEETIESRVARIKARVAELTGNMETGNGPQVSVAGNS
ncbi:hypothetical protein ED733_007014 [Metarhizium rileyi]|uniref:Meiotically up-regulated protein Msb1/Mug8 domain-containing protein n=1 Tax=Metarhizium rileyi (strain RCEF 4871) TaxID=1649241 RepID=A0A5C6GC53_METRR|nr:hypothetical protein ED733_007014 [Metarhizium rileyi]